MSYTPDIVKPENDNKLSINIEPVTAANLSSISTNTNDNAVTFPEHSKGNESGSSWKRSRYHRKV